jgi:hypothetical protein
MKVLGNATTLLVALSIMVGLLFAQRNYQNSWHESPAAQMTTNAMANASTLDGTGQYQVVIK